MAIDENKILLGKILGEIYRIQSRTKIPCNASPGQIYGLLNGFEHVIEEELESIGYISRVNYNTVANILNVIFANPTKFASFKGYYDIEPDLTAAGIDRGEAKKILKYLYAEGLFVPLIDKMNSSGSPVECLTFDLSDWEK